MNEWAKKHIIHTSIKRNQTTVKKENLNKLVFKILVLNPGLCPDQ